MKQTKYFIPVAMLFCSTQVLSEPLDFYGRLWLGAEGSPHKSAIA